MRDASLSMAVSLMPVGADVAAVTAVGLAQVLPPDLLLPTGRDSHPVRRAALLCVPGRRPHPHYRGFPLGRRRIKCLVCIAELKKRADATHLLCK